MATMGLIRGLPTKDLVQISINMLSKENKIKTPTTMCIKQNVNFNEKNGLIYVLQQLIELYFAHLKLFFY